jgi:hypothetical protein
MGSLLPREEIDNEGDDDAEKDAGGHRDVDPHLSGAEVEIAGQPADGKLVGDKEQHAYDDNNGSGDDKKTSDIYPVHDNAPVSLN